MMGISRRRFLTGTASLAVAGAGLPKIGWGDPLGLPVGIQLYTVGADLQKDAPATIKQIARIGYKEVETAGYGSAGSAAALRKLLDDNGIRCPSAHLSFDLKNLNKAFDDAHALGCAYATASVPRMLLSQMPPLDASVPAAERAKMMQEVRKTLGAPLSSDDLKRLIDLMNQVGAAAKQQELMFAVHNHTFEFDKVDDRPAIFSIMEKTDPDNIKFEIDCGWAEVAGFHPGDLAQSYPGRIRMLHIKDFLAFEKGAAPGSPAGPKGAEIGAGVIDYKKIFADMRGKGVEHIFVEQEGPYSRMPAIQAAEVDYKFLHSLKTE